MIFSQSFEFLMGEYAAAQLYAVYNSSQIAVSGNVNHVQKNEKIKISLLKKMEP